MSLVRFEPWSLVDRINRDTQRGWVPAVDIFEDKDQFIVRADLPGMSAADIDVSMDKGVLSISGERHREAHGDDTGVARYERASGRFLRRFSLPDSADVSAIKASSANGILELTIPKQAVTQARRITVEAA